MRMILSFEWVAKGSEGLRGENAYLLCALSYMTADLWVTIVGLLAGASGGTDLRPRASLGIAGTGRVCYS